MSCSMLSLCNDSNDIIWEYFNLFNNPLLKIWVLAYPSSQKTKHSEEVLCSHQLTSTICFVSLACVTLVTGEIQNSYDKNGMNEIIESIWQLKQN